MINGNELEDVVINLSGDLFNVRLEWSRKINKFKRFS